MCEITWSCESSWLAKVKDCDICSSVLSLITVIRIWSLAIMNRISDYSKQTWFQQSFVYLTIVLAGLKACSLIATLFPPGPELVNVAVTVCYMFCFCDAAGSLRRHDRSVCVYLHWCVPASSHQLLTHGMTSARIDVHGWILNVE